jgi:hypothetical protein
LILPGRPGSSNGPKIDSTLLMPVAPASRTYHFCSRQTGFSSENRPSTSTILADTCRTGSRPGGTLPSRSQNHDPHSFGARARFDTLTPAWRNVRPSWGQVLLSPHQLVQKLWSPPGLWEIKWRTPPPTSA